MKILLDPDIGRHYGEWTDTKWKDAPVTRDADGFYWILSTITHEVNVNIPLVLHDIPATNPSDIAPEVPNNNETITKIRSWWGKVNAAGEHKYYSKQVNGEWKPFERANWTEKEEEIVGWLRT